MRIILASGSPRRRELLEMLRVKDLEIVPANGEKKPHPELSPDALVAELSRAKAAEVYSAHPDALVIGADTVVSVDGTVLGKPADRDDAVRMLRMLSGRAHHVFTGVTVMCSGVVRQHTERTEVRFRSLTDEEILAYVDTGEPMDKAGAYGVQGIASLLVEGIDGDFFNVMGLPVCALGIMLKSFGVSLL